MIQEEIAIAIKENLQIRMEKYVDKNATTIYAVLVFGGEIIHSDSIVLSGGAE